MSEFIIKVKHKRFLLKSDADRLSLFRINNRVNNAVYGEYTAHIPTNLELTEQELEAIKQEFNCVIEDNIITIELGK